MPGGTDKQLFLFLSFDHAKKNTVLIDNSMERAYRADRLITTSPSILSIFEQKWIFSMSS